jgi:hypothetical protein
MVFSATFNNISVISWWSVLLVEETWIPRDWEKQLLRWEYFYVKPNDIIQLLCFAFTHRVKSPW